MNEFQSKTINEAVEKLKNGKDAVKGQKEQAMAAPVLEALQDFCKQDAAFAKAVLDGGSFADCMKAVAKGVTTYISDLDAYKRAVQFFIPKADISMQLTITQPGSNGKEESAAAPMTLTLDDLLG